MELTRKDESTLNFLAEMVSEKIGAIDFLMQHVETQLMDGEHRHSALQIKDALGRAKAELTTARELSSNVVNFYYERIVAESSSNAPITNDIIRVVRGLKREYPNEGGSDLGRRLSELFKPHQINLALANLTDRHAWAMSEDAFLANAQSLVGVILNNER